MEPRRRSVADLLREAADRVEELERGKYLKNTCSGYIVNYTETMPFG